MVVKIQEYPWVPRGQQFCFLHGDLTGAGDNVDRETRRGVQKCGEKEGFQKKISGVSIVVMELYFFP